MTTQTPTQIATELMKGCGLKLNNGFEYSTCGEWSEIHKQPNYLCKSCRKTREAYKTAWTNELEDRRQLYVYSASCSCCHSNLQFNDDKISELTQALKILDGGQA